MKIACILLQLMAKNALWRKIPPVHSQNLAPLFFMTLYVDFIKHYFGL